MSARASYIARIHRVMDHIDAHLAEPLDLAALAEVAHMSPWHFHRIFQAFAGETLADRVRRRRLEVAAGRLLAKPPRTALAIALDVGFGSAEAFTRAFKAHFGVTPGDWRRGGSRAWVARHRDAMRKIHQGDRNGDQALEALSSDDAFSTPPGVDQPSKGESEMDVTVKTLPETRVAYMRHIGPYGDPGIVRLWQRFEAWCRERGLFAQQRAVFGISHDSADLTAPQKCRYDACIAVDDGFRAEGEVGIQTVPGGLHACAPFRGTGTEIHGAWMRLYGVWLPESVYQEDDRPAIEAYGGKPEVDSKTGAFSCELCLPVKAR